MADTDIQKLIDEAVTAARAESAAELQAAQDRARFHETVTDAALRAGVYPQSIRHVLREAGDIFEVQGGRLVPRHGELDPDDPVASLTLERWLEGFKKSDPNLFVPPSGRVH